MKKDAHCKKWGTVAPENTVFRAVVYMPIYLQMNSEPYKDTSGLISML